MTMSHISPKINSGSNILDDLEMNKGWFLLQAGVVHSGTSSMFPIATSSILEAASNHISGMQSPNYLLTSKDIAIN